jgi:hypothetical protein
MRKKRRKRRKRKKGKNGAKEGKMRKKRNQVFYRFKLMIGLFPEGAVSPIKY